MKKSIFMLAAVGAAACCLAACTDKSNASQYDKLNEMLNADYSQIALTVTNTFDDNLSLKSEYTIKYSDSDVTVEYVVEKFTEIDLNNPSADLKTTLAGEAVIRDGVIVSVSGDDVGLIADIVTPGLDFKEEYFKNADLSGVYLIADVKNPSPFLGWQVTCTDMHVEATFLKVFYDIQISYKSENGNKVEYSYVFTL